MDMPTETSERWNAPANATPRGCAQASVSTPAAHDATMHCKKAYCLEITMALTETWARQREFFQLAFCDAIGVLFSDRHRDEAATWYL